MYKVPVPIQQHQADRLRHALSANNALLDEDGRPLRRMRYVLPSLNFLAVLVLAVAFSPYQFAPI